MPSENPQNLRSSNKGSGWKNLLMTGALLASLISCHKQRDNKVDTGTTSPIPTTLVENEPKEDSIAYRKSDSLYWGCTPHKEISRKGEVFYSFKTKEEAESWNAMDVLTKTCCGDYLSYCVMTDKIVSPRVGDTYKVEARYEQR